MQDEERQLAERLIDVVEDLQRRARNSVLDGWQGQDITIPQAKTLVLLEAMGPLRMGVIARHLGSGLSATTALVDRLVEKGLVMRGSDPGDRRVVTCELSAAGQETIEQFLVAGRERAMQVADLLQPEQLEAVVQGLEFLRWAKTELGNQAAAE